VLRNVSVSRSPAVAKIEGLPEMPISGSQILDLVGSGDRRPCAFGLSGLALRNLRIHASQGDGFPIRDAEHLKLAPI